MLDILNHYVQNLQGNKVSVNGYDGYKNGDDFYFIISKQNDEEVHFEQKAISDFCIQQGIENIAVPLFNYRGTLTTEVDQKEYLVLAAKDRKYVKQSSHAKDLASFHNIGSEYPYTPNYLSSYGQWKELWENKISMIEDIYNQQYVERPVSPFHRLFIDTFPYIIGLSENALQYLQETETDQRFHDGDKPSITFRRYSNQLQRSIIWSTDFSYDHPVRDLAEYIRPLLLQDNYQSLTRMSSFFTEYEQERPLSIFGWRLLYARLLFPIHLFDHLEAGFRSNNLEIFYKEYKELLQKQTNYETNLKSFYKNLEFDTESLNIPVIDW
ncbi:spore coat putative kinase YutH [Aquibacillus albus]|uniref:Spore coat protein YutH n=1 Tax=Aquibacillus albus TaxID=1168171 RepID=A0ABS2MYI2_9BACI|nr:spore coat protein YutH [Aquibacillus albus]MBM7570942.1 spore coat protein YutH [Aquibacillus albus]